MEGWIKIHRGLLDWEWYSDTNCVRMALHLLLKANFQTKRWRGITVERGQLVTSRSMLARETGLSEREVRTAIAKLEKSDFLTSRATSSYTIVTICNYEKYQSTESAVDRHQTPPLDAHRLGHGEDQPVALQGADQGQSDARISARGFDDRCPGAEDTPRFGLLDHGQCHAVLDAAGRVERLDLGHDAGHGAGLTAQAGEFDQRGAADEFQNGCCNVFSLFHLLITFCKQKGDSGQTCCPLHASGE